MTGSSGRKAILLLIANDASTEGVCYSGQVRLAEMGECARETVSRHLGELEKAGLIARRERRRANGSRSTDWIVLGPNARDRGEMHDGERDALPLAVADLARPPHTVTDAAIAALRADSSRDAKRGGHVTNPGGPETVTETVNGEGTQARGRVKEMSFTSTLRISGKPVTDDTWGRTCDALMEWNQQTGSALSALTGRGHPSEAAKRIYGRLVDWPDLDHEQVADIIRRTLSSKWWGDGPASVGVVFGPKVFEDNVHRPAGKNGRAPTPVGRFTRTKAREEF